MHAVRVELFVRPHGRRRRRPEAAADLRIRRISAYDIEKNRSDIDEVVARIKEIDKDLRQLTKTTIRYVKDLIARYGDDYPRRTEITGFEAVDKKAVARQSIKLAYDKESGFFGSAVRGDDFKLTVSEYDFVLGIADDGTYRVMPPPEKLLFTGKLLYCAPFDPEAGAEFTVVYRDKTKIAYAKRVRIEKFIRNKEYQLVKDRAGKVDLLLPGGETGTVELRFAPAKRQRVKQGRFDLAKLELTGTTARGTRLAAKPVSSVKLLTKATRTPPKAAKPDKKPPTRKSSRKKAPRRPPSGGGQGDLFS